MKRKRKRKKHRKIILPAVLFVAIILAVLIVYFLFKNFLLPYFMIAPASIPQLSVQDYTEVVIGLNVTEEMGIVTLVGNCHELDMIISRSQAISLEYGITRIISERPNTHDLIKDMLKNLDAKILMIKIVELKDGTYYARLLLRKDNLILSLDSRPSDALAIASRVEYSVPVYVKDDLLETVGRKIC